ncbi:hypothetical protein RhiJN_08861 [Ceratobasidium sp. AG-Ba]|nr:hypothetical protein RhiJN_08861 [Ceratobasidium sp. AG-Ba]
MVFQPVTDAIQHCNSFIQSLDFAKSLDPSRTLDYISMGESWDCKWIGTHTLKYPKRGNLSWIGKGPQPEFDQAMQATKIFVLEEWIGDEVKHLVRGVQKLKGMSWCRDYKETMRENTQLIKKLLNGLSAHHLIRRLEEWEKEGKEKVVPKWVEDSPEWWFQLSDIEEMKENWLKDLDTHPMNQKMVVVADVVWEWCEHPNISRNYQEKAWDKGNKDLLVDMANLLLEPLEEDEEWVKLKEEVWGAEAPNSSHNIKSHLPAADF